MRSTPKSRDFSAYTSTFSGVSAIILPKNLIHGVSEMDTVKKIYDAMLSAERECAEIILHKGRIHLHEKSCHRDVVTEYDSRVQALLVERLKEAVPDARFCCEESNMQDDLHAEHVFVIDPIDGTMNFVKNFNHSCISIGYLHNGVPTAAAVYDPYMDEMFSAIKGEGAWLNGTPIRAAETPLSENVFSMGTSPYIPESTDESFRLARIAYDASLDLRRGASAELDLAYVAAGRSGLFFELSLSFWDYAAGMLLVEEAGGKCTSLDFSPLPLDGRKSSVLAGGRQCYDDFAKLM